MRPGVLGLLALCAALAGCESPQTVAREEATLRWNGARGRIKAKLAADQLAAGNIAGAASDLAEAERLNPEDPALLALRARMLLSEGKPGAVVDLLARSHQDGTVQAETEYSLGVAWQQQQRWAEALAAFERAETLDQENVAYLTAAAQTELQLGRPEAALDRLEAAAPRFAWTDAYQATLAECCEQRGDWLGAAAAWRRVAAGTNALPEVRRRLAEALYRAKRFGEVISVLTEALEQGIGDKEDSSRLLLGECYLAEGRPEAARLQAQIVVQRDGQNVRGLRLLARVLAAEGDYGAALRIAQKALALDGQDGLTLELATALAWRAGDRERAAASATQLLRIEATNAVARQVLAQLQVSASGDTPE